MKPLAVIGAPIPTIGIARLSTREWRCFALRGVTFEKGQRKAEGQARANLIHGASIRARVTAEIVADSVDQPDQARERLLSSELILVEDLSACTPARGW